MEDAEAEGSVMYARLSALLDGHGASYRLIDHTPEGGAATGGAHCGRTWRLQATTKHGLANKFAPGGSASREARLRGLGREDYAGQRGPK